MSAWELIRLAVGVPLVLFGPGLAWSYVAFPHHRRQTTNRQDARALDAIERGVVAFGLSIVLGPLAAIAWGRWLGLPLGTWGSLLLVALLIGSGVATAIWRSRDSKVRAETGA